MGLMGLAAPQHVGSFWTRDQTFPPALAGRHSASGPPGTSQMVNFEFIGPESSIPFRRTASLTHKWKCTQLLSFWPTALSSDYLLSLWSFLKFRFIKYPVAFSLTDGSSTWAFGSQWFLSEVKWSHSVVSDSLRPHRLQPASLLCPWDFPGSSTGVDCHFLLQGIFPNQGSNPGLPHCRQTLYRLSHPPYLFVFGALWGYLLT